MKKQNNFLNKILKGNTLDVLKKLPSNFVDVGVTSPPYNKKEKNKGWLVKNVKYADYIDKVPEKEYQKNQIDVLNEVFRITKEGGSFFYNHKLRWERGKMIHPMEWLLKTDWAVRQEIVWDRRIAANIRGWRFWQTEERIYWLYKPSKDNLIGDELESRHALLTSVWKISPERNNPHPAPFPIALPTRCIFSILNGTSGVVLDPYAGSGTTLVSAKKLGHSFIGIDVSDDYIKQAEERIENINTRDKVGIEEELLKHKVNKTFKQRKENGEFTGKFKKTISVGAGARINVEKTLFTVD